VGQRWCGPRLARAVLGGNRRRGGEGEGGEQTTMNPTAKQPCSRWRWKNRWKSAPRFSMRCAKATPHCLPASKPGWPTRRQNHELEHL